MPLKLQQYIFIVLAFIVCSCVFASERHEIIIYYEIDSSFQASLANAINEQLSELPLELKARLVSDRDLSKIKPGNLVISIGNQDGIDAGINQLDNRVIYINDTRNRPTTITHNASYTNIQITQPPCRYLNLIKTINKKWKRVGYLSTTANDARLPQLRECASKLNLTLIDVVINDNNSLPDATENLLRDSEVLLALPDSNIYNRHSVKNILLTAYRHRIPVIGFSDSFVRAGALAGVFSTSDQLARQVISIIKQHLYEDIGALQQNIPPAHFSAGINTQVAKALDVDVIDEAQIVIELQRMEAAQ